MDPDAQAVLKMLDGLDPVPRGPVSLSSAYLRAVRAMENHPDNRSGADKTWIGKAIRQNLQHLERARLR